MPGAQLATRDFTRHRIEGLRLDGGGRSTADLRVVGVLTYVVLKTFAFQDRHDNKDAYDLIFTLANYPGGPSSAGSAASTTAIATHPQVNQALKLVAERFETASHDGPVAHANFLAAPGQVQERDQLANQAVAAVRQFLTAFNPGSL